MMRFGIGKSHNAEQIGASGSIYKVERYSPLRRRIKLMLGFSGIALLSWGAYEVGLRWGSYQDQQEREELKRLRSEVNRLEEQRSELLSQLALLERSTQVERRASQEVKQTLNGLQTGIVKLKEELAFGRFPPPCRC